MSSSSWSAVTIPVACLIVAGLLVGPSGQGGSPAGAPSPSAARVGWINISAVDDYGYSPPVLQQVPTNANITVRFTDETDMEHTFTIIGKEGWVIPSNDTNQQIQSLAYGNSPRNLVNVNVSGPGDVNVTNFTSPGPGWYEFVCTVAGHFQLGMYGFIAFGMNLPSNLTVPSRTGLGGGLSFTPLDAGIVAVFLAIATLAAYGWYRRRSRKRART